MTKKEFAVLAATMKATYQRDNFMSDKESIWIWYEFLKDISNSELACAISNYIKTETFPPTVADILKYVDILRGNIWSVEWNKAVKGENLSEMDYPGQYAYRTIGEEIVQNSRNINVMLEFKKLYKEFSLMDKTVKSELFKSGLMVWKNEDVKAIGGAEHELHG